MNHYWGSMFLNLPVFMLSALHRTLHVQFKFLWHRVQTEWREWVCAQNYCSALTTRADFTCSTPVSTPQCSYPIPGPCLHRFNYRNSKIHQISALIHMVGNELKIECSEMWSTAISIPIGMLIWDLWIISAYTWFRVVAVTWETEHDHRQIWQRIYQI